MAIANKTKKINQSKESNALSEDFSKSESKGYCLYILRNDNNKLYIGITNDLTKRVTRHNNTRGANYTKTGRNFILVYKEYFPNLLSAMRREKQLKGWTRAKKEALIKGDLELLKKL